MIESSLRLAQFKIVKSTRTFCFTVASELVDTETMLK